MDKHTEKVCRMQIARLRASADHLIEAAMLLERARVDHIPNDIRLQASEIFELADSTERHVNGTAEIHYLHDYRSPNI